MPRYAHLVTCLAVFVALGGTAHAAGTLECGVPQPTVRSVDLGVETGWEGTSAVKLRCARP